MPRGIKKTEIDRARELLEKASMSIEIYERLRRNDDFKLFMENTIDKPIISLIDLQETATEKDWFLIREQIKVLRSIKKHFDTTLSREEEVKDKLAQLK